MGNFSLPVKFNCSLLLWSLRNQIRHCLYLDWKYFVTNDFLFCKRILATSMGNLSEEWKERLYSREDFALYLMNVNGRSNTDIQRLLKINIYIYKAINLVAGIFYYKLIYSLKDFCKLYVQYSWHISHGVKHTDDKDCNSKITRE